MLIPFTRKCSDGTGISAVERSRLDEELDEAMESACSAAAIVIEVGSALESKDDLERVLRRVEHLLPASGQALQRIVTSYYWLMFATNKVTNYYNLISEIDYFACM